MDVGISTACFYPEVVETAAEKAASLGFKTAEVFVNCDGEFSTEYIKSLKYTFDKNETEVISVHPFTSGVEFLLFFTDYERRLKDGLLLYERYFKAAKMLGARFFIFHGMRFGADFGARMEERLPSAGDIRVYKALCESALENGLVLAQENVAWCFSRFPSYLKALKEETGGLLGFNLDIKQARRAGTELYEYLDVFGDALKNVHINDYSDDETCLLPGEGRMDYRDFFSRLKRMNYSGDLIIEVYASNYGDLNQITRSKEFLLGELKDLGELKNHV